MAKRKANSSQLEANIFEQHEEFVVRRQRRQRALIIPKKLWDATARHVRNESAFQAAHQAVLRWADLESTGRLERYGETTVDTQFLDQVFGQGLGYRVKTASPEHWELEHKFPVPGVGTADGALGNFPDTKSPLALIELKDAGTDLDRDRSGGRTAVQQCWDYLSAFPACPWGIVSNFSTIRLYHRDRGRQVYEEFTLQELRKLDRFKEFYYLFERSGLIPEFAGKKSRALTVLEESERRQKEVGDELYRDYQDLRLHLIDHLMEKHAKPLDGAIHIAQKLLDRVIFIAFCEDRDLIPRDCLERAWSQVSPFLKVRNPRWKNFLGLFHHMDGGSPEDDSIPAFNGGLFADDAEIDNLDLPDDPWAKSLTALGAYDFSEEVNVDVLGHLFERSINELEKLRIGGKFALLAALEEHNGNGASRNSAAPGKRGRSGSDEEAAPSKMPKSAQRKRLGIYYTPPAFTNLIVERTVDAYVRERFAELAKQHGIDPDSRSTEPQPGLLAYWQDCWAALKSITVCDPACGSGAFLIRAYDALESHYKSVAHGLASATQGSAGVSPASPGSASVSPAAPGSAGVSPASPGSAGVSPAKVGQPSPPAKTAGSGIPSRASPAISASELARLEDSIPDLILTHNLYGVDLSKEGVEITQLALWIRSARRGKTLANLSSNIIHGNSLVADPAVDPKALDWPAAFPRVFQSEPQAPARGANSATPPTEPRPSGSGFSCVIGNPPWERVKLQEREFFSLTDPATAEAVSAAQRRKRIAAMPDESPELHSSYVSALERAQKMLDYARRPADAGGRYPLTGRGDVNLYMLFAELARALVASDGIAGLLVPSGIATDDTTKEFFQSLMGEKALISLYDFENKEGHFEDVHRSFKFSALVFGGADRKTDRVDFVFFARGVEEVAASNKQRHIPLTEADMKLLNPNTRTCPIFRTRRDADITKAIYKRVPILIDENRRQGGNPWGIKFFTMFHQTNDAEHFLDAAHWRKEKYKLNGNVFVRGKQRALPLYEAKMFRSYDHRHGSVFVKTENWMNQGQADETTLVQHQNPEFLAQPRWWVDEAEVVSRHTIAVPALLAFRDITRATDARTMIASFIPVSAVVNTAPLAVDMTATNGNRRQCCLLANWNSIPLDFVAKRKIGHIHLNFFIVEQLPTLPPDAYADKCRWSKRETLEHWISERVLKLSCTAEDMIPLAKACDFKGSRGDGVHIWKETERVQLRAELDAAYFHLYGLDRDDAEYILSTFTNTGEIAPDQRAAPEDRWRHGGIGETTLAEYDRIKNLM